MSLNTLKIFFRELTTFIRNVAEDERIPSRDKKVLLALVALVVSPIDLIPDWIPIFGVLDDIAIIAIVLDYFFNVIDQNIILSHFPWDMKRYVWIRRTARLITGLTPSFIKKWIWKYQPDPYSSNSRLSD